MPMSPSSLWRCSVAMAALVVASVVCIEWVGERMYVDEPGLLAGLAAPQNQQSRWGKGGKPAPPRWTLQTSAREKRGWLLSSLRSLRAEARLVWSDHGEGCDCDAVAARIRARRGDGREAILLSISRECEVPSSVEEEARIAALIIELAGILTDAQWLAKDVLLHLPSCCSCAYPSMAASSESGLWATATHRTSGCSAAPLRYFLSQYTLQTPLDGSPGAQANAGFSNKAMSTALAIRRGGGLIRQALTLSLCGSDSDNSNRRESSLCVELRGHAGRLANLDLYSAIWRVAQLPAVRVPLAIATGRRQTVETVRIGAAAIKRNAARGLGAFKTLVSKALHQATLALRPSATLLAFSAGQAMGGHPESPHAPALDLGIDSLHMYTDRSGKCSTGAASLGDGVADGQVLSLLQLVVRSLSNLHEALHHSHYVYFPLSASSFLPLSRAAPLFLGLPLASLGLRAAAHVVARKPIKTGDALAIKVIAATHAAGAALLLLPALAWPLPWPSLPGIAMLPLLLVVQFIWFCIARKASLWADGTAGIPSSDILSAGACTLAAFISSLLVASNIPLAMHAACSLALLAAFALPPPRAFDSELKAAWRPVVVDVLALAISSPAGALFIVSWLWGVPPLLAMGRAGEAFAHRTDGLVCVFVCAVYLPFSLCVAAVLLRRFVPSPNELPSGAKRVPRRVRLQCHSPNGTSRYPTRASKRAKNPSKCL